jgi:phosphoglycerate dehydrogenase-like enzyme
LARKIVVIVDGLSEEGKQRIRQVAQNAGAQVNFVPESQGWAGHLDGIEAAFGLPPAPMVESSQLRFLQLHSSGYDPYKTPALLSHPELRIANARGVTAQAVAEQCLAMMFALTRRIPFQLRNQTKHLWQRSASYELLFGRTITIAGMGAIGSALAKMCHGIGMRVFSVQRKSEKESFVDRVFTMDKIVDALRESQHLALALPTIPLTRPLIGAEELAAMQNGSYVYSMSRAPLLDYDALLAALDSGKLSGAGLDVFPVEPLPANSPLWDREDVLIAPHSGGRFVGEMEALAALFAGNLERYLSGEPLHNVVISKDTAVS